MSPSSCLLSVAHQVPACPLVPARVRNLWQAGHPRFIPFAVGQMVLYRNHQPGNLTINKLRPRFDGPFAVERVNENGVTYTISRELGNGKIMCRRVHYRQLKVFHGPPDNLVNHPCFVEQEHSVRDVESESDSDIVLGFAGGSGDDSLGSSDDSLGSGDDSPGSGDDSLGTGDSSRGSGDGFLDSGGGSPGSDDGPLGAGDSSHDSGGELHGSGGELHGSGGSCMDLVESCMDMAGICLDLAGIRLGLTGIHLDLEGSLMDLAGSLVDLMEGLVVLVAFRVVQVASLVVQVVGFVVRLVRLVVQLVSVLVPLVGPVMLQVDLSGAPKNRCDLVPNCKRYMFRVNLRAVSRDQFRVQSWLHLMFRPSKNWVHRR